MIRNLIDGQDVPMKLAHKADCPGPKMAYEADGQPVEIHPLVCTFCGLELVIDVHQQRLEHQKCPNCPTVLRGDFGPAGWFTCRCCGRAWRRRTDGYYDEQVPLGTGDCSHLGDPLA